jgi:hypothetical protein
LAMSGWPADPGCCNKKQRGRFLWSQAIPIWAML